MSVRKGSLIPAAKRSHAWGRALSIAFLSVGLLAVVGAAMLGYPMYAALIVSFLLLTFAVLRIVLPGRPWFSSRNKPADASILTSLALLIAYFSQFASIPPS